MSMFLNQQTRQLLYILCLPLIDGVFASMLVSGSISGLADYLVVGLTIFSGAGALAILFSHSESRREAFEMVLQATPVFIAGALLVALIAPVFEQLVVISRLQIVSGIALIAIAANMTEISYLERIDPSYIILLGLIVSLKNPGALGFSLSYIVPAISTAGVASLALFGASFLAGRELNLTVVRYGGALVLFVFGLSMLGLPIPSEAGLGIFSLSFIASIRRSNTPTRRKLLKKLLELLNMAKAVTNTVKKSFSTGFGYSYKFTY